MIITKTICDICKQEKPIQQTTIPIRFLTEQNEGRSCEPYIDIVKVDICRDCLLKATNIEAVGAMGYNEYNLKEK